MRARGPFHRVGAAATLLLTAAAALPAGKALTREQIEQLAREEFAHYGEMSVAWLPAANVRDVRGVYPHLTIPGRVVLTTGAGLLLSGDAGKTWSPLPAASPDRVGAVLDVDFRPDSPDVFYLATEDKGVWGTDDAGRTFRQVGSTRTHLASDHVRRVCVFPGDLTFKTLYALHGRRETGISRSYDAGQTWDVIARDYHVWQIARVRPMFNERRLAVVASRKASPEVQSVYICGSLDDLWSEVVRDVVYADAWPSLAVDSLYVATSDAGLQRVDSGGGMRIGPPEARSFASVGVTWGPRADKPLLYAYDPARLGMVLSLDDMKTFTTASRGLFVGPFVKEGAHVRATADGKRFFAAVNGGLYVGYVRTREISVAEASVTPPVFIYRANAYEQAMEEVRYQVERFGRQVSAAAAARELLADAGGARQALSGTEFRVTARVQALRGRARSVTVDLSDLAGEPNTPMFDDGRHGDGDANDGLYGLDLALDPRRLGGRDSRAEQSGVHGLSVKATAEDGTIGGAVAVLSVFHRPEGLVMWDEGRENPLVLEEGEATFANDAGSWDALSGDKCIGFATGEKPWRVAFGRSREPWDIAGYYALSFWVKTDSKDSLELLVQLRDAAEFDYPVTGKAVPVVADGFIEGGRITSEWRRVLIPLDRLLKDTPDFHYRRFGWVVLSGDGKKPATFRLDAVVFHVTADDAKRDRLPPLPGKLRARAREARRRTD